MFRLLLSVALLGVAAVFPAAVLFLEHRAASAATRSAAAHAAARAELVAASPTAARTEHLAGLRAQVAARADQTRHLRLLLAEGRGELRQRGWVLREFPFSQGAVPASLSAERASALPPLRLRPGIYEARFAWGAHPPPSLFLAPPAAEAPWPQAAPEQPWDAFLVGDVLVYSASPPLPGIDGDPLPGTLRVRELDLAAILPNLTPGTAIYAW